MEDINIRSRNFIPIKGRDVLNKIQLRKKGGTSKVTIADVYQSNGVIHVVDAVLMPN